MGYRDEQLALRLRTEAAEKRAADADRRRLAAQAEVERLRMEIAYARAAPPDPAVAATKRALLVFLGGLAAFVVMVGVSIAFKSAEHRTQRAPFTPLALPTHPAPLTLQPPMIPLPPEPPMMPIAQPY